MTQPWRRMNDRIGEVVQAFTERTGANRGPGRMVIVMLVAFAIFTMFNSQVFLNPINLQNIMIAAPEIGVIAIAMTLAMLTGGIDLSLVAIANLTAITISTTFTAVHNSNPELAEQLVIPLVLLGLLVGLAGGLINSLLISVVGITPILATLGTMQIFNGIAVVWTGGSTLYGSPEALTAFGRSAIGFIPALFIVFIIVAIIIGIVVNKTAFGQKVQLEGANPVAAKYSGIRSQRVLTGTYTLAGLLAGVAGVLFISRNPTASADYGASYVLLVIVIAVLGGANPTGGFASVFGVVLAALTLQIVASGFTSMRLSSYQYEIAQGIILVGVMIFDAVSWERKQRRRIPSTTPAT